MGKTASVKPIGFGSSSIAYTDGNSVVKEIYNITPEETNARFSNFKKTLQPPKEGINVIYPRVVSNNNRVFLVSPFIKGTTLPASLGDDYYKDLVNYKQAKELGNNYLDRGHANFIRTFDGKLFNIDPVGDLGENVRETVKNKILNKPLNRLSKDQRILKKKLIANPRLYDDPHMWRLIQTEMERRTRMDQTLFNIINNS